MCKQFSAVYTRETPVEELKRTVVYVGIMFIKIAGYGNDWNAEKNWESQETISFRIC